MYRNEDIVRIDSIKILEKVKEIEEPRIVENTYIPEWIDNEVAGINYRLNTTYTIQDDIRKWNKVNVKYVEKHTNKSLVGTEVLQDEDGDNMYFYSERIIWFKNSTSNRHARRKILATNGNNLQIP